MLTLAGVLAFLPLVFPPAGGTPYFQINAYNPTVPSRPVACAVPSAVWDKAQEVDAGTGALLLMLDYERAVRKCMTDSGVKIDGPSEAERALREQLKRRGVEI